MRRLFSAETAPLVLFLIGAAATIGLLMLFAYAPDARNASSSGNDALSRSAVGYAGLDRLLRISGIPTELDRGAAAGQSDHPSLTILTPNAGITATDWRDYQEQGASLIILPKWLALPMQLNSAWVMKAGAYPPVVVTGMVTPLARAAVQQQPGDFRNLALTTGGAIKDVPASLTASIQQLQTISPPRVNGSPARVLGVEPMQASLLVSGHRMDGHPLQLSAVLVRVRSGDKPVYILSEPDLMNNHGLADATTAKAALAIVRSLRRGNGPVRFDVTLNGLGHQRSLLEALVVPPFRGATIAAVLAALLMGFHALARFGAPLRTVLPYSRGKQALADNTAALLRIMGREGGMARRYIQTARDLALARLGARRRSPEEQERLLAAMETRTGGAEYDQLAAGATLARTGGDLLRIAGRAYAWRRRISGEHQ